MQRAITITTALITTLLLIPTPHASAAAANPDPSIASFEGGHIDLRDGWGQATACTSDGVTTECFRTEKELDQYLAAEPSQNAPVALDDIVIQSVCSTSLKLYANASFGGTVLALSTRLSFLNLSTWSFDNVTSSYKVGACSATFYDGANGGAPTYPGDTSAGASATSMQTGWDNRISSVYIS
jgi:hypothetical protein